MQSVYDMMVSHAADWQVPIIDAVWTQQGPAIEMYYIELLMMADKMAGGKKISGAIGVMSIAGAVDLSQFITGERYDELEDVIAAVEQEMQDEIEEEIAEGFAESVLNRSVWGAIWSAVESAQFSQAMFEARRGGGHRGRR